MRYIQFNYSKYSDNPTQVLSTVSVDLQSLSSANVDEYFILNNKLIISVYDPLYHYITGGSGVGGQLELCSGLPTGKYNTIDSITIPRGNGLTRRIPLQKLTLNERFVCYVPLVDESCGIGINELYLTADEKRFYGQFILTDFEPTLYNILSYIR